MRRGSRFGSGARKDSRVKPENDPRRHPRSPSAAVSRQSHSRAKPKAKTRESFFRSAWTVSGFPLSAIPHISTPSTDNLRRSLKHLRKNTGKVIPHLRNGRIMPAMDWSGIILRLLAWLRPLLWYRHGFCRLITIALRMWDDEPSRQWFAENPAAAPISSRRSPTPSSVSTSSSACAPGSCWVFPSSPRTGPASGAAAPASMPPHRWNVSVSAWPGWPSATPTWSASPACAQRTLRRERDSAPVELIASHRPAHAAPAVAAAAAPCFSARRRASSRQRPAHPRAALTRLVSETQAHPNPPAPSARPRVHVENPETRRVHGPRT